MSWLSILGGILTASVVGILIAFILVNMILGCETWDQTQWTEMNRCLTISQIWEGITND